MSRKKKAEKEPNHERWLLTYSDLITLLMIFFVIMFASSSIDKQKFKTLAESMNQAMGGGQHIIGDQASNTMTDGNSVTDTQTQTGQTEPTETEKLTSLKQQLDKYLQDNNMSNSTSVDVSERGLVVTLNNSLFFDPGKADLKPENEARLIEIGKILNQMNNYIRVEGHTDNVPISNSVFHSNWQLSAARASTVVELLISRAGMTPQKLSTVGYGEYRPIADNNTAEGRQNNRRVDLVVMSSKFDSSEQK